MCGSHPKSGRRCQLPPTLKQTSIDLVNKNGEKIGNQNGEFPISYLFPDEKFVIIDWMDHKLGEQMPNRPTVAELQSPVIVNNTPFHGDWAWGSMVKKGETIGLTRDLGKGVFKKVIDGQRFGRWLLYNGMYGITYQPIKVKVIRAGEKVNGHLSGDGFGFINRSFAEKIWSGLDKIKLGKTRESFSWWQRVPWSDELKEELMPIMQETAMRLSDPWLILTDAPASFQEKKDLVELDRRMLEHPFIAESLLRASAEFLARASTTVNLKAEYRVAIPTELPYFVWPGHSGNLSISRFPIDSNSSVAAFGVESSKEYDAESKRISEMEVIQYSLSGRQFHAKGCMGVIDNLDCDVIITEDDIKLGSLGEEKLVLSIGSWWDAGSAMGINLSWGKEAQGWDCDGDAGHLADLNNLPILFETIKALPPATSIKLKKISPLLSEQDNRAEKIIQSMQNLVGAATNVASATFQIKDREWLAREMRFPSLESLDKTLNYLIKCGTDGYKTEINLDECMKNVMQLQSRIIAVLGQMPQWPSWPDGKWFVSQIPGIEWNESMSADVSKNCLKDWQDGTVPKIARIMLPAVEASVGDIIARRPLREFRQWAMKPSDENLAGAEAVQEQFFKIMNSIDWNNSDTILGARARLNHEIDVWMAREELSYEVASQALWWVAHTSEGEHTQATSVFWGFPEESKWIVETKPGLLHVGGTIIITGLNYQLPNTINLDTNVQVVEHTDRGVIRKVLVASVNGQLQPEGYPEGMIAIVAKGSDQPEIGSYFAQIRQATKNSWKCWLAPNSRAIA